MFLAYKTLNKFFSKFSCFSQRPFFVPEANLSTRSIYLYSSSLNFSSKTAIKGLIMVIKKYLKMYRTTAGSAILRLDTPTELITIFLIPY